MSPDARKQLGGASGNSIVKMETVPKNINKAGPVESNHSRGRISTSSAATAARASFKDVFVIDRQGKDTDKSKETKTQLVQIKNEPVAGKQQGANNSSMKKSSNNYFNVKTASKSKQSPRKQDGSPMKPSCDNIGPKSTSLQEKKRVKTEFSNASACSPPGVNNGVIGLTSHSVSATRRTSTPQIKQNGSIPDNNQHLSDVKSENSDTHVIFALDCSGSMRERDVKSSNGKISRWNAVFSCVDSFLGEQMKQQGSDESCFVSVLIFNTKSKVLMNRVALNGDGDKVRSVLNRAKKQEKPKSGTSFTVGFKAAYTLAASGSKNDKVMLVFLTDGRPGDLHCKPPKAGEEMQPL